MIKEWENTKIRPAGSCAGGRLGWLSETRDWSRPLEAPHHHFLKSVIRAVPPVTDRKDHHHGNRSEDQDRQVLPNQAHTLRKPKSLEIGSENPEAHGNEPRH
jgi:hypothetical protein